MVRPVPLVLSGARSAESKDAIDPRTASFDFGLARRVPQLLGNAPFDSGSALRTLRSGRADYTGRADSKSMVDSYSYLHLLGQPLPTLLAEVGIGVVLC